MALAEATIIKARRGIVDGRELLTPRARCVPVLCPESFAWAGMLRFWRLALRLCCSAR